MKHILKIIENNLKRLEKDDRKEFREAILKSFSKITEGIEERIENFEQDIVQGIETGLREVDIYIALIPQEDYYLYEDKFFPMKKIKEKDFEIILNSEEKIYADVFLDIPYNQIYEYDGREIKGIIKVDDKEFEITFVLSLTDRYQKQLEKLYEVFSLNGLRWKTVFNPYVKKMFSLKINKYSAEFVENIKEIKDYEIKFLEVEDIFFENMLLCWNINEKEVMTEGIVSPTRDRIHLENNFNFTSNKNIYLCPNKDCDVFLVEKVGDEKIRVISEDVKNMHWRFWEIEEVESEKLQKLKYPSFNNKMEENFINQYRKRNDIRIRTVSELERVLNSFPKFKEYFKFDSVLMEDSGTVSNKGYDLNEFIIDEFRLKGSRQILKIKLIPLKKDNFTIDIMSFFISEIQLYFAEYECVGELL